MHDNAYTDFCQNCVYGLQWNMKIKSTVEISKTKQKPKKQKQKQRKKNPQKKFKKIKKIKKTKQNKTKQTKNKQRNKETLRGRAVYAYVLKKNVDGQGTQAIIKNLNLKTLKRF